MCSHGSALLSEAQLANACEVQEACHCRWHSPSSLGLQGTESGSCRRRCAWDGLQLHPCCASPQHDLTGVAHVRVGACRVDQSTCYNESSPWYEATHHGLDSMMQRIISELTLMTKDTNANLNIATNTR